MTQNAGITRDLGVGMTRVWGCRRSIGLVLSSSILLTPTSLSIALQRLGLSLLLPYLHTRSTVFVAILGLKFFDQIDWVDFQLLDLILYSRLFLDEELSLSSRATARRLHCAQIRQTDSKGSCFPARAWSTWSSSSRPFSPLLWRPLVACPRT